MEKAVLIRESDGKNIEYALEEGKPVVIGRGSDCDIKIPIDWISRRHAEINYKDDHYEIKDLGSSNGTSVNKDNIKNIPYRIMTK